MAQSAKQPELNVVPLQTSSSLRTLAYGALKRAITEMDIYGQPDLIRLDERQLSQKLGVSRTPIGRRLHFWNRRVSFERSLDAAFTSSASRKKKSAR